VLVLTPSGAQVPLAQVADMQRVTERLKLVVPFTLFLIRFLLYASTKSPAKTLIAAYLLRRWHTEVRHAAAAVAEG
jgi:Cu/Ag efflux pump CusA